MFENIASLLKGGDFLGAVSNEFKQMLDNAQTMYAHVCDQLIDGNGKAEVAEEIYRLDQKINATEKDIRKRILEHLVMQPTMDVSACLVLMSVVKDAERLGDYCKNLLNVTKLIHKPIDQKVFKEIFGNSREELLELFKKTKVAYIESEEHIAAQGWDYQKRIRKQCNVAINQLADGDLSVNEAVCLTLIARHFKRLASHLTNIATSAIVPLSELDYYDEKVKEGLEDE